MANIIDCQNLTKKYESTLALREINLSIGNGKIVGLLGPNGSGKTTLLKIIAGLLVPTSGNVFIDGLNPSVTTKKVVAFLPERNFLDKGFKVKYMINFMQDFYKDFHPERALALLKDLNIDPNSKLSSLSKGTLEKVQLILVMSRDAKLYILDEPIGGVDPAARDYILKTIISNYNKASTVIISTHLIADVEAVLDEFIFIQNGNILKHDSVAKIKKERNISLDALFREEFRC